MRVGALLAVLIAGCAVVVYAEYYASVQLTYVQPNGKPRVLRLRNPGIYASFSPERDVNGVFLSLENPPTDETYSAPTSAQCDVVYDEASKLALTTPWIALTFQGECTFTERAMAAQRVGASGVIVVDRDGKEANRPKDDGSTLELGIPSVAVSLRDGEALYDVYHTYSKGQPLSVSEFDTEPIPEDLRVEIKKGAEIPQDVFGSSAKSAVFTISLICLIIFFAVYFRRAFTCCCCHETRVRRRQEMIEFERQEEGRSIEAAIQSLPTKTITKKSTTLKVVDACDDATDNEDDTDVCAVCLESFEQGQTARTLQCNHDFHKDCIDPWLRSNPTCPLCKRNILEEATEVVPLVESPEVEQTVIQVDED